MRLYYSPGACSLAPRIIAEELGLKLDFTRVDLRTKLTDDGKDFLKISPKGAVPTLEIATGEILTEGTVIHQYLCDQAPGQKLLPMYGQIKRYRVMEWLNYIATEVHKAFSPLFSAGRDYSDETIKNSVSGKNREKLYSKLDFIEKELQKGPFLMGDEFTVADAYLFNVLSWSKLVGVDLSRYSAIMGFWERVNQRPAVQRAKAAEGLK